MAIIAAFGMLAAAWLNFRLRASLLMVLRLGDMTGHQQVLGPTMGTKGLKPLSMDWPWRPWRLRALATTRVNVGYVGTKSSAFMYGHALCTPYLTSQASRIYINI